MNKSAFYTRQVTFMDMRCIAWYCSKTGERVTEYIDSYNPKLRLYRYADKSLQTDFKLFCMDNNLELEV